MTLWFRQLNHASRSARLREGYELDVDAHPAPTVMAYGIAGCCRSHYWVEADDGLVACAVCAEREAWRLLMQRDQGFRHDGDIDLPGLGTHTWQDVTDEPSPTITGGGGGQSMRKVVMARITGRTGSQFERVPVDLDGPMNTVIQSDPRQTRYELHECPPPPEDIGAYVSALPAPPDKPPYRVPSMAEIAARKGTTGLRVVSTFSGCGGSCLGFEMAGYDVLWASEFVAAARDVYRLNHPGVTVDDRDIRTVTGEEILAAVGLERGEVDVLEGSPPCASFSSAGKRDKHWGEVYKYSETEQRTDDLFFEFARIVEEVQPRVFVAENVAGLVRGRAKGYFKEILRDLRRRGYRVKAQLLDAQWLGVPQSRQRLIFQGVRADLDVDPAFPEPLPYRYSVRDALPWITGYRYDNSGWHNRVLDPDTEPTLTITLAGGAAHVHHKVAGPEPTAEELEEVNIERYAIGREAAKLAPGQGSDKYLNLARANPDKPSPTVTQTGGVLGAASVVADATRKFTIGELRRICGFPDDFALRGTYQQQWERLGRAVPPPMMYAVARTIRDEILQPKGATHADDDALAS